MFRINITHDVDHLSLKEHLTDFTIIRFVALNLIALARRNVSCSQFAIVCTDLFRSLCSRYDTWRCLDEWLALEDQYDLKTTWFVACRQGKGIAYSMANARKLVNQLLDRGHSVGLHSQSRTTHSDVINEMHEFRAAFGITGKAPRRMHYLSEAPLPEVHRSQFIYDSSVYDETSFSRSCDFHRPINIMDTFLCSPVGRTFSEDEAKAHTIRIIDAARKAGKEVIIDVHQRSLSKSLPRYRRYVLWLYAYLADLRG